MFDDALFRPASAAPDVPEGLPLVAGLTGFADAGGAVSQLIEWMGDTLECHEIGRFNNDALLDYRARRPVFQFDETHLTDFQPPKLSLSLVRDELGQPFLFLAGYEPDMRWESATEEIVDMISRFKVQSTTWVHAIPMPVPHTRTLGVTVSGNRPELTDKFSVWRPTTGVPGTMMHLVEWNLQGKNHPVAGFVVLVPHYLADTEFPVATVTALESLTAATGRIFPTDSLREQGRTFLAGISDQVENNEELQRLVGVLETRHDSYMEDNPLASPLMDEAGEVPSAEAIAQELQNFLAHQESSEQSEPPLGETPQ